MRDHVMPPGIAPTVFMMASPMKPASRASSAHQGVACVSARDFRWEHGDIKSTSLLGNVLARQITRRRGRARDDHVPRRLPHRGLGVSNVWVVKNGAVLGPPQERALVLEGIRYG